jgi:CRISPR-associated protein Cmr1
VNDNAEIVRQRITSCFGSDVFGAPKSSQSGVTVPWLAGASLLISMPSPDDEDIGDTAISSWGKAINWLREFRQGVGGGQPARQGTPNDPGLSNWPEADKIRRVFGDGFRHRARAEHTSVPAWPRAAFGLPIVGEIRGHNEPGKFELRWKSRYGEHDRLASALILKPFPLANGKFLPCALWLRRGIPPDAEIGLGEDHRAGGRVVRRVKPGTEAPFHRPTEIHPLLAAGDAPLFEPLRSKATLRNAFCDWLARMPTRGRSPRAVRIAP